MHVLSRRTCGWFYWRNFSQLAIISSHFYGSSSVEAISRKIISRASNRAYWTIINSNKMRSVSFRHWYTIETTPNSSELLIFAVLDVHLSSITHAVQTEKFFFTTNRWILFPFILFTLIFFWPWHFFATTYIWYSSSALDSSVAFHLENNQSVYLRLSLLVSTIQERIYV